MLKIDRKPLDDALVNMFTSAHYQKNALFYAHIVAQMKIHIEPKLPAPCGVSFTHTHYNLYVNLELFAEYSLDDRIFILVHECMHIIMGHLGKDGRLTGKNINHDNANLAEDCAINQLINMKIPKSAIVPSNLLKDKNITVKSKQNSEYYYNLLKDNEPDDNGEPEDGEEGDGEGSKPSKGKSKSLDTHDTWNESVGDADLQKDVTAKMIDEAIEETVKSRGNLPQNIEHIMSLFKRKSQIDWKKVLRNIVGRKKVGKRPTIMRKSRRFQNRPDIKGHTKDRKFDLVVIVDISGSMNDSEILQGLSEINSICKTFNTSMKLIQVDTNVHKIEEFTQHTKIFERNGCGGTIMEAGMDYLYDNKILYDGIIYITDGYIEDVSNWKKQPKCKVMWLCTSPDHKIPGVDKLQKHSQFPLKVIV